MSESAKLAEFAHAADFTSIGRAATEQLKVRILVTLGAAVAALDAPALVALRHKVTLPGDGAQGEERASVIGGGTAAPADAAFCNAALGGWLDYTDAYVGSGAGCRPSDCIGPVLAAAECAGAQGRDLLAALAVGYEVQVRLCDARPQAASGVAPSITPAVAAAAGRVLGLPQDVLARGIGAATVGGAPAGPATDADGTAAFGFARAAAGGLAATLRAAAGPAAAAGGADALAGSAIDWTEAGLDGVLTTAVKHHLADIHLQAPIDAALSIRTPPVCDVAAIQSVRVTTWQPQGGSDARKGEAGGVAYIHTPAQARGSVPYVVAAALLDGQVQAPQYAPERIARPDIQALLQKVQVIPLTAADRTHLDEIPTQVAVVLNDGTTYCTSARSWRGYSLRQPEWDEAWMRFQRLLEPRFPGHLAARVADCVHHLEDHPVRDLTALFAEFTTPAR